MGIGITYPVHSTLWGKGCERSEQFGTNLFWTFFCSLLGILEIFHHVESTSGSTRTTSERGISGYPSISGYFSRTWFSCSHMVVKTLLYWTGNVASKVAACQHLPHSVPPLEVLTSALSRSFCWKRQDKVLEPVIQGQVAPEHGWLVMFSRPGRSGGDEPGGEAIGGREP